MSERCFEFEVIIAEFLSSIIHGLYSRHPVILLAVAHSIGHSQLIRCLVQWQRDALGQQGSSDLMVSKTVVSHEIFEHKDEETMENDLIDGIHIWLRFEVRKVCEKLCQFLF